MYWACEVALEVLDDSSEPGSAFIGACCTIGEGWGEGGVFGTASDMSEALGSEPFPCACVGFGI